MRPRARPTPRRRWPRRPAPRGPSPDAGRRSTRGGNSAPSWSRARRLLGREQIPVEREAAHQRAVNRQSEFTAIPFESVAGGLMGAAPATVHRRLVSATIEAFRTPAVEPADGGHRVDRALRLTAEPDARPARPSIEHRRRRHEGARVGVARAIEDGVDGALLDNLAEVHHEHAVGEQAHDVEVVRDEEVAHREALRSAARSWRITACTDTSSAEVGSSRTRSLGSTAMARAIPTRCFWPPESWWGRRPRSSGGRPHEVGHRADALADRARDSAGPSRRRGSAIVSNA